MKHTHKTLHGTAFRAAAVARAAHFPAATATVTGAVITAVVLTASFLFASCSPRTAAQQADSPAAEKKRGYELEFGEGFRPGMNSVDELGISIVIVMDTSGSMAERPSSGGKAKYLQASEALQTVAGYLAGLSANTGGLELKAALLTFSDKVRTVMPLADLDAEGLAALEAACAPENFAPRGGTAIGLALERASEILAQSGTIFNSVIIVTDGENTINPEPDKVIEAIYANRNNKSTEDMPIRTSTQLVSIIGFDIDSPKFARLHELGARVTQAGDGNELVSSLKSLLEADISKLEGN